MCVYFVGGVYRHIRMYRAVLSRILIDEWLTVRSLYICFSSLI